MALEAFSDPTYPLAFDLMTMTSTHVNGDLVQSSNSDGQHKEQHFQALVASLFSASPGNVLGASANISHSNVGVLAAGTNPTTLNATTDFGLSVGASCFLAGVKSADLRGPDMPTSASTEMDCLNLSALPLFSSHNSSISESPATSDSSIARQDSQVGKSQSWACKRKRNQKGIDTKDQSGLQNSQNSLLKTEKHGLSVSSEMHNRPGLDIKEDAVLHQHVIQQLLLSQDNKQFGQHSSVHEALNHQHKKHQNILQSIPELQGVDLKKQRQQQMRDYLQQLALQEAHHVHRFDGNVCSRRLTQYMYHLQRRPPDNGIAYWRKFVAEYYSPCAKKRWCFSQYNNLTPHTICVFPRATVDTWHCGLCWTKFGRGFEATFEVLPRLNKMQFESGVTDELLFLDLPRECKLPSGLMMLEYEKAVHETVFDQLHVVHEGKLRIVFTLDLKISSWEFCSHNHEELLPRSSIASQVNEFVNAAQKFQMTINDSTPDKTSPQNLEKSHNMLVSTGCKLQRDLNVQLVGDLGYSKRYIRCLQIANVLNSMKDLMTFSWENKVGPIESLKNYSQKTTSTNFKKDEYEDEKLEILQGMPSAITRILSASDGLSSNKNNSNMSMDGLLTSSEKAALMHAGDYCKLLRQSSISFNIRESVELSGLYKETNQCAPLKPCLSSKMLTPEFSLHSPLKSCHESNRDTQELMIQKLLQDMVNNSIAANWTTKEPVNCIMNDVIASLPSNSKRTGSLGSSANGTSVEKTLENASSSIIIKNGSVKAICNRETSKHPSGPSFYKEGTDTGKEASCCPGPEYISWFK